MNKKSNYKLATASIVLIILSLLVIATNTTINETENQSILNESNNQNPELIINESMLPDENISQNLSLNETILPEEENQSLTDEKTIVPAEDNNLEKIASENDFKFNAETKEFFESDSDKSLQEHFIIKYRQGFDKSKLSSFSEVKDFGNIKVSTLEGKISDLGVIISDEDVKLVELDQDINLLGENIPFNIMQVGADSIWNLSAGGGIKVAVLDTGTAEHYDLSISNGWNVIDNNSNYSDNNGHGTMVSGVIDSLLNNEGLVGVSPNVSLYAVKVIDDSSGSLSDAIAGVEWAMDNNMNIISMSFGFDSYSQIFKEVLQDAYDNDILLVSASGNDGENNILYPAAYDTVIAVGAVDETNEIADFSNYGFELELVAPGVNINSTTLNDGYSVGSGTSLAVPHVTGVAALIWSYNHSLTNEQVRAKLRNDALDLGSPGKDDYYGFGLVHANLSAENYNYSETNYYYEVYNITDYGLENESYWFWLSGNGTIDDIDFALGYYLINKTIEENIVSEKIFVNEAGIIIPLLFYPVYINYIDDYSTEGTTSDNIAWVNGQLDMYLDYGLNEEYIDGECYRYRDWPFDYEKCYFRTTTIRNLCDADSSLMSCGSTSSCTTGIIPGQTHDYIDTASAAAYTGDSADSHYFVDCGLPGSADYPTDDNPESVYVINMKRFHCINSTHYTYQGWYGSGWINYAGGTCSGTCSDTGSLNYTNANDQVPNSCANSTDLAIVNIIPIQVIPDVDMVLGKSGYVVVNVTNYGPSNASANVSAWFEGIKLNISVNTFGFTNNNPRTVVVNSSELFVFDFNPWISGTNKVINASVR